MISVTTSKCCLVGLIAGILFAGAGNATACGNGKLILEDKFDTLDPAWGFEQDDDTRSNGPGA